MVFWHCLQLYILYKCVNMYVRKGLKLFFKVIVINKHPISNFRSRLMHLRHLELTWIQYGGRCEGNRVTKEWVTWLWILYYWRSRLRTSTSYLWYCRGFPSWSLWRGKASFPSKLTMLVGCLFLPTFCLVWPRGIFWLLVGRQLALSQNKNNEPSWTNRCLQATSFTPQYHP